MHFDSLGRAANPGPTLASIRVAASPMPFGAIQKGPTSAFQKGPPGRDWLAPILARAKEAR